MSEIDTSLGGKVWICRRETFNSWYCSTYLNGKERRKTTKKDSLAGAKESAEDWYLTLRGKSSRGELKNEKTFAQARCALPAKV